MPVLERRLTIAADPQALAQTLAAVEHWPRWTGFVRTVEPPAVDVAVDNAWNIVALLGSMPFSAVARLQVAEDGRQVTLETLTSAAPVNLARYFFLVELGVQPSVTLRVQYTFARGPGGWLVERAMVRRKLPRQLEAALAGLADTAARTT